ncbi:MAG: bifunctional oligoribonuclease/PAP phosphatase NrnA [Bacteroidales bacterium]|nr:bifunctional oligoribonuclease/PAP phosphatase NrnA [Bacteroidales bacterium]
MSVFDLDIINAFTDTLGNAKNIVVIGHKNIDGDSLGASLAVSKFFKRKNIQTKVIVPNQVPLFFNWVDDFNDILIYEKSPWTAVDYITDADVIFMIDFSDFSRIDDLADSVEVSKALKIVIDHHREPKEIADFMFVDTNSSSAAELVYDFLKIIDNSNINKDVAEYIYMGIASDTGNFMYDSVTSKTFATVSELLSHDINKSKIVSGLFNNFPISRLKFIGYLLHKKLTFVEKYQTAYITISLKEKEQYGYKSGDLENLVNMPLSLAEVKFSILFTENDDGVHLSLRSKGNFDVSNIARVFFNGGGHKNAAGGRTSVLISQIPDFLDKNIDEIFRVGNK